MKNSTLVKREILSRKRGKIFVKETLKMNDGNSLDWYYLDMPKSLIVVPLTKNNDVLLVRIYRHNFKKHFFELPSGKLEKNDRNTVAAAKREFLEETGYTSDNFAYLGKHYVLPSETNRWVYIYLATDIVKTENPKLDNEIEKYFDMSIHFKNFKELLAEIGGKNSKIKSIEHGFALQLAENFLKTNKKE